jgi:hypothetical protein
VRAAEECGTGYQDDLDDILLQSLSRDALLAFLCTITAAIGECLLAKGSRSTDGPFDNTPSQD